MTPADVLATCEAAGLTVALKADGSPAVQCPPGVRPNAALLAALIEHRARIVELLGGTVEPEVCPGTEYKGRPVACGAIVFHAVDSDAFCSLIGCPFRRRARG